MLKYCLDIDQKSKWIICPVPEAARDMPFCMTEYGSFICGGDYYTERDSRTGYQLIYTISGKGVFFCGEDELELLPNTAVLIRCSELHRYETARQPWHNIWIHFEGSGADAYEKYINNGGYSAINMSDASDFTAELDMLKTLAQRDDVISCALVSDCISGLMTELLTARLSAELSRSESGRYPEIRPVLDFIHKNYYKQITIDDMTHRINISKYHFIRIFKRQMGVTPYEYLIEYRISRAKILLRTTNKSIYEISYDVGYRSRSNFISRFRESVGVTPAQYRDNNIHT